jgi:hypothetical protein
VQANRKLVDRKVKSRAGLTHFKILCHGRTTRVRQFARSFVAHPGVDTTTARIKPSHVRESKVFFKALIHDLDSHLHESPASAANFGSGTSAPTDVVIVGQVNVKDEFALDWLEGIFRQRFVILGSVREDGS